MGDFRILILINIKIITWGKIERIEYHPAPNSKFEAFGGDIGRNLKGFLGGIQIWEFWAEIFAQVKLSNLHFSTQNIILLKKNYGK